MPISKLLVPALEAAEMLSVSKRSVMGLISTGALESIRIGNRRLIRLTDLNRFIKRGHFAPVVKTEEQHVAEVEAKAAAEIDTSAQLKEKS